MVLCLVFISHSCIFVSTYFVLHVVGIGVLLKMLSLCLACHCATMSSHSCLICGEFVVVGVVMSYCTVPNMTAMTC